MEEILKSISEKISSYNIFNNLFPGIIFCSVMTKITRFNFATDTIIEIFCENWQNPVKQRITPHFLTTSPSNYYEFTTKE